MNKNLISAILTILLISTCASAPVYSGDFTIIRLASNERTDVQYLIDIGADVVHQSEKGAVTVIKKETLYKLHNKNMNYEVINEDADEIFLPFKNKVNCGDYHTYSEMIQVLKDYENKYPEIMKISNIGTSLENRNIWSVKISDNVNKDEKEPVCLLLGSHHAREWISTEVCLGILKHILENYNRDERVTNLVNSREIYIVPMANPDGVTHSQTEYKMWRKNRRDNNDGNFGVDLNRNYGYKWGGVGASADTYSDTYRGRSAFSEPETDSVRKLALEIRPSTCITYHSYSELVLYPWGFDDSKIKDKNLASFGKKLGVLTGYKAQSSSDLYFTTGDTTDWLFGELGCYAYTIELATEFIPPENEIQSVIDENLEAGLEAIDAAGYLRYPLKHYPPLSIDGMNGNLSLEIDRKFIENFTAVSASLNIIYPDGKTEIVKGDISDKKIDFILRLKKTPYINYSFSVTESDGNIYTLPQKGSFVIKTEKSPILLICDDKNDNYLDFYKKSLDANNFKYDIVKTFQTDLSSEILNNYSQLVWFTGKSSNSTIDHDDYKMLMNFLSTGGTVFLTGQDIAYDMKKKKMTEEMKKLFSAVYLKDNSRLMRLEGKNSFSGLTVDIKGGTGASNQKYPDLLEVAENGVSIFNYVKGGPEYKSIDERNKNKEIITGCGGIYANENVVFLGFGFEAISNETLRNSTMKKIVNLLKNNNRRFKVLLKNKRYEALKNELSSDIKNNDFSTYKRFLKTCGKKSVNVFPQLNNKYKLRELNKH